MHIRNRQTQKTQSPHAAKSREKRENGIIKITISNKTPKTINEKENLWGFPPWNGQWKNNLPLAL
jgi:hypothetical protein